MFASPHAYKITNKDTSYEIYPSESVYAMVNARLTSDKDSEDGGISNVRGTKYAISLPEGIHILGHASVADHVYLITTDNITEEGGTGFIYKILVDQKTVTASLELIYANQDLKLSTHYMVQAYGIKENSSSIRLYFSDYRSETRAFNVLKIEQDSDITFTQIFPDSCFVSPLVDTIYESGSVRKGVYEFAYYLTTFDGKKSLLSENSQQIHLISSAFGDSNRYRDSQVVDEDVNSETYGSIQSSNKSVKITADISDQPEGLYKFITFVSIYKSAFNVIPEISEIETISIPTNQLPYIIYSGTESEVIISHKDYLDNQYPFFTNKTFASKDNLLLLSNTKEKTKDVDYDASTYRYKSDLSEYDDYYKNPYNDESGKQFGEFETGTVSTWANNDQYKYQNDGTTLGGSGVNIDYKFVLQKLQSKPYNWSYDDALNDTVTENIDIPLNDGYEYSSKYLRDFTSPYKRHLRGYKRGEIYRFAIQFQDKKGNKTFAKYIGDIKMPEISDKATYITIPGTNIKTFPTCRKGTELYESVPLSDNNVTIQNNTTAVLPISNPGAGSYDIAFNYYVESPPGSAPLFFVQASIWVNGEQQGTIDSIPITPDPTPGNEVFENINISTNDSIEIKIFNPFLPDGIATFDVDSNLQFELNDKAQVLYSLGVEFNVKNMPEGYCNYQILCVQREDRFKTRMAQGFGSKARKIIAGFFSDDDKWAPIGSLMTVDSFDNYDGEGQHAYSEGFIMPLHFPEASYDTIDLNGDESVYIKVVGYYTDINVKNSDNGSLFSGAFDRFPYEVDLSEYSQVKSRAKATVPLTNYENKLKDLYEPIANSVRTTPGYDTIWQLGTYRIRNYVWNIDRISGSMTPEDPTNYTAYSGTKQWVELENHDSLNMFGYANENFQNEDDPLINSKSQWILEYLRLLPEHYGGNNEDAVSKNIFFPVTRTIKETGTVNVFDGDIYVSFYDSMYAYWDQDASITQGQNRRRSFFLNHTIPVESTINIDIAYGFTMGTGARYNGIDYQVSEIINDEGLYFAYDTTYSSGPIGRPAITKPINFEEINENPTRTWISDAKIYGESIDAWTKYRLFNFRDIHPDHGPITKSVELQDEIFMIQERAFGRYSINPRAITSTADGQLTELGSAQGLQDFVYVSTDSGSTHQFSIITTDSSLYFYDSIQNRLIQYVAGKDGGLRSLAENMGYQSLFKKSFETGNGFNDSDRPYLEGAVVAAYESSHREVYFTFHGLLCPEVIDVEQPIDLTEGQIVTSADGTLFQASEFTTEEFPTTDSILNFLSSLSPVTPEVQASNSTTLVWSEKRNTFNDRYSHIPRYYFNDHKHVMSSDPLNHADIHIHDKGLPGNFYGVTYPTEITLILNGAAKHKTYNKMYAYCEYNTLIEKDGIIVQDQGLDGIHITNDYQDTGLLSLSDLPGNGEHVRRFRKWRFHVPTDAATTDYIRGPWSLMNLTFDNSREEDMTLQTLTEYYTIHEY